VLISSQVDGWSETLEPLRNCGGSVLPGGGFQKAVNHDAVVKDYLDKLVEPISDNVPILSPFSLHFITLAWMLCFRALSFPILFGRSLFTSNMPLTKNFRQFRKVFCVISCTERSFVENDTLIVLVRSFLKIPKQFFPSIPWIFDAISWH